MHNLFINLKILLDKYHSLFQYMLTELLTLLPERPEVHPSLMATRKIWGILVILTYSCKHVISLISVLRCGGLVPTVNTRLSLPCTATIVHEISQPHQKDRSPMITTIKMEKKKKLYWMCMYTLGTMRENH